jgi:hypothetical protein
MQRKINHDDFERFLQQNAEQVRMYPSSAVWNNISKDLNKRRRRWFAFIATLIITVSTGGYFLWNTINTEPVESKAVSDPLESAPYIVPSALSKDRATLPAPDLKQYKQETFVQLSKHIVGNPQNPLLTIQPFYSDRTITDRQYLLDFMQEEEAPLNRTIGGFNEIIAAQKANSLQRDLPQKSQAHNINNIPVQVDSIKAEEAVVNVKTKERKLNWQIFFSPNISYRKLSENKSYARSSTPPALALNYLGLYDVNNAVTHKPNMGFELGITTKYSVTKSTKLRAGLQFNINRYDIKAFSYLPEVATITLNNGYGVDFVNTISNYRNFNGGKTNWLENFYFQASVPLGAEVKVTGNNKMHVGVASTLQPTYVIGDRAYLITNDYKNYAQLPWLIRRWNVNTSLETFVSYSAGKTKWQVGPQVRYQLLSSFVSKYPVKENLFDFGLKVGLTLNHR